MKRPIVGYVIAKDRQTVRVRDELVRCIESWPSLPNIGPYMPGGALLVALPPFEKHRVIDVDMGGGFFIARQMHNFVVRLHGEIGWQIGKRNVITAENISAPLVYAYNASLELVCIAAPSISLIAAEARE